MGYIALMSNYDIYHIHLSLKLMKRYSLPQVHVLGQDLMP
jgi:hypothetical protein